MSNHETQSAQAADVDRPGALGDWFPKLYAELRALAHAQRARHRHPDSPGTTSIVHEAYIRLAFAHTPAVEDRAQFFLLVTRTMRSILVDNARRAQAVKHGGDLRQAEPGELERVSVARSGELLALDAALQRLEQVHQKMAAVVACRCFGGLTVDFADAAHQPGQQRRPVLQAGMQKPLERGWNYRHDWQTPSANG